LEFTRLAVLTKSAFLGIINPSECGGGPHSYSAGQDFDQAEFFALLLSAAPE
jgi:hypothetical protein